MQSSKEFADTGNRDSPGSRREDGAPGRALHSIREGKASNSHPGADSGPGPGPQIDFDFTEELSKSCKSQTPGGISLLLRSFGKLIIPINI